MTAFGKAAMGLLASLTVATGFTQQSERDGPGLGESERAERRAEILQMATETLATLHQKNVNAADLLDKAYGGAVFDTTKGGFIVTGAGGTGVATRKLGGEPVYMHVGEGGVGLGAGLENYRLVILFEDKDTYDKFIEGAWSAGVSAQAAGGREGAAVVGKFVNGVAVYHLSNKGVIAQVDVTGMKFWPADRLNEGPASAASDSRSKI